MNNVFKRAKEGYKEKFNNNDKPTAIIGKAILNNTPIYDDSEGNQNINLKYGYYNEAELIKEDNSIV